MRFLGLSLLFVLVIWTEFNSVSSEDEGPVVEVAQGKVQGAYGTSRSGRKFAAIHLPFGTAERFEAPRLAENWVGVYNGTELTIECAQTSWWFKDHSGVEDCLLLSVYTPDLKGNLPVMVYFHGGGFHIGGAKYYEGGYLMDEDVVFVSVNYRLGAFGFLSTGDEVVPGNNGLKDQNLALRWVKENIRNFGGDPSSVTLFGNSAGGASVNYHILSKSSAGLFHAGIAQSGSSLCPWAFSPKPQVMAKRLAKAIGCPEDSKELLKCLKGKSAEDILKAEDTLVEWGYDPFTPFGPVVEPDLPGAFLAENPQVVMETGRHNQVPLITGVAEDEGILMHAAFILHFPELRDDLKANWKRIFPISLELNELYTNFSKPVLEAMAEKIKNFYFGDKDVGVEETRQELTDLFSDRYFNLGVREAAILQSKFSPVYLYQFAYNRGDGSITKFFGIDENYGVSHADEGSFLFPHWYGLFKEFEPNSVSEQVSKNLVKLWTSFAREKNSNAVLWGATKTWNPIEPAQARGYKNLQYLRIDAEPTIMPEPFLGRVHFWKELLREAAAKAAATKGPSTKKDEL